MVSGQSVAASMRNMVKAKQQEMSEQVEKDLAQQ